MSSWIQLLDFPYIVVSDLEYIVGFTWNSGFTGLLLERSMLNAHHNFVKNS